MTTYEKKMICAALAEFSNRIEDRNCQDIMLEDTPDNRKLIQDLCRWWVEENDGQAFDDEVVDPLCVNGAMLAHYLCYKYQLEELRCSSEEIPSFGMEDK